MKEIELSLLDYIYNYNNILDKHEIEEKYFINLGIYLRYFKALYKKYKNISNEYIIQAAKNKEKAKQFIVQLGQTEEYCITENDFLGKYELLKDLYYEDLTKNLCQKYINKEIGLIELEENINNITKLENSSEDLIEIQNIGKLQSNEREYTNIKELDRLTKGIEYGAISLWSGITNSGKTTMMIQFAKECINNGKKIFFFAGEQSAEQFKNYLYITMCQRQDLEFIKDKHNEYIYDVKPKDEKIKELDEKFKDMIYLYNNNNEHHTIKSLIKTMNKAIKKGVRIFFIDNFMQIDNTEKLENQTNIIEQIKQFTMRNKIILNLVVHPRKNNNYTSRLNLFDIAGTQNISNKASNIFNIIRTDILGDDDKKYIGKILAKNDYDIENCDGVIEVLKTKGNECKMVGLNYDKELKIYVEAHRGLKGDGKYGI